jgi:hypothetical protein
MADPRKFLGKTAGGVFTNFLYDLIKVVCGGSATALAIAAWQYLTHRPVDWWGTLALGLFTAAVFTLLLQFHRKKIAVPSQLDQKECDSSDVMFPKSQESISREHHEDQLNRLETLHKSELWRSGEFTRQCETEKREALAKVEELQGKLAFLSPLQVKILQLTRDLRILRAFEAAPQLENTGPMKKGEDLDAWMRTRLDETGTWSAAYARWERKLIYSYRSDFAERVREVMLLIGKTGMIVASLEPYTTDVRPGDDFQSLIELLLGFLVKLEIPSTERELASAISQQDAETTGIFARLPLAKSRIVCEHPQMGHFVDEAYRRLAESGPTDDRADSSVTNQAR